MSHELPDDLLQIYRQAKCDGMVKIGIPTHPSTGLKVELCWAKRLSPSYARIDHVSIIQAGVGFGDVVEFRERAQPHAVLKEFVRVVSCGSEPLVVAYATRKEAAISSKSMRAQLRKRRCDIDRFLENPRGGRAALAWVGAEPGVLCIALPVGTTEEEAERLLASCPHLVDAPWV